MSLSSKIRAGRSPSFRRRIFELLSIVAIVSLITTLVAPVSAFGASFNPACNGSDSGSPPSTLAVSLTDLNGGLLLPGETVRATATWLQTQPANPGGRALICIKLNGAFVHSGQEEPPDGGIYSFDFIVGPLGDVVAVPTDEICSTSFLTGTQEPGDTPAGQKARGNCLRVAAPPAATYSISGKKTEDTDRSGTTAGDTDKVGWNIYLVEDLNDNGVFDSATETFSGPQATGAGGTYSFTGLTAGNDYLVCEDSGGTGWTQLAPTGGATCTAPGKATNGHRIQNLGANQTGKDFWNQPPAQPGPPIPQNFDPDLSVTKTGTPASIPVGGTVSFTMTVTNVGTGAASNVVLTDSMPAGLSFVSSTPGAPTCSNVDDPLTRTDTMTCQLGTLAAGASITVTVVATGTAAGTHVNTAVVGPTDATPSNNTDTEDTVVTPVADLSVTKTVDDVQVTVGQQVTYTLTVTNHGPSDASGVVVTDTLPAELTYVSSDGACTGSSTITCTIGDLAVGATVMIHVVAQTTEPGTFTNGVEVISTTADPDLGNNSDEVDVEASEVKGIQVRPDAAEPKQEVKRVLGEQHSVLPFTGMAVMGLSGLGMALILTGGMLLLMERRRRTASVSPGR